MPNYEEYYSRQAKGYGLPIFIGGRSQRGNGLGNILAGIARAVVPVLKRGGKSLLEESVRTGASILQDVVRGGNIKTSANRRLKEGGTRLVSRATDALIKPSVKKPIKRKTLQSKAQSRTKRRKVTQAQKDIFD